VSSALLGNSETFASTPPNVHPDSSVERRLALPVSLPSCAAFGGPQLDHLVIATSSVVLTPEQLQAEPLSASLLIRAVDVTGVAEPICDVR
jgi:sugar lactone lactonase YvrE